MKNKKNKIDLVKINKKAARKTNKLPPNKIIKQKKNKSDKMIYEEDMLEYGGD